MCDKSKLFKRAWERARFYHSQDPNSDSETYQGPKVYFAYALKQEWAEDKRWEKARVANLEKENKILRQKIGVLTHRLQAKEVELLELRQRVKELEATQTVNFASLLDEVEVRDVIFDGVY